MDKKLDAVVLGEGVYGQAIYNVIKDAGKKAAYWTPESKGDQRELAEVVATANLILVCVSSRSFKQLMIEVGGYVRGNQCIVHLTKGLDGESGMPMSEVIRENSCILKIGALSGPIVAGELERGEPGGGVIASKFNEVKTAVQEVFSGSRLKVYGSDDLTGVEIGAVFTSIIAFGFGMVDGLGLGSSSRALLMTRGASEMARFGKACGADLNTFGGLAGIGNIMAACDSDQDGERRAGIDFSKGESLDYILARHSEIESIASIRAVYKKAQEFHISLPIINGLNACLEGTLAVASLKDQLMSIATSEEMAGITFQPREMVYG